MTSSRPSPRDRPVAVSTITELRELLDRKRGAGRSIGFVPTLGYLHDGHGSLMRAASADNDIVVTSIFVNPLQFGENEDLSTYPRDLERDTDLAAANGVDVLFTPDVEEMYPKGAVLTSVSVARLSQLWDGISRPTHFAGMATVVAKLFNIVGSSSAYFGMKDFQQLCIIRQMVYDLSMPIRVVGCPIQREADGLAMSSRNVYLTPAQRQAAPVLHRALQLGSQVILDGERDPAEVEARMQAEVGAEPLAELEYAAAVAPETLTRPDRIGAETRLLIAAQLGTTRLIDNCGVTIEAVAPKGAS